MEKSFFETLTATYEMYPDEAFPKVSIIIPSYNSALSLPRTLKSLLDQDYPDYEIIVVDAGSIDRTIEIVKSFYSDKIKIFSVSHYQPFEMLNKGITLANGEYLNFLQPGDFYLSRGSLRNIMTLALANEYPSLVYSGSIVRSRGLEVSLHFLPLNIDHLKKGEEPTYIESCFFLKTVFQKIGKFDPSFELKGDFDLFCRFVKGANLKYISTSRVIVDYDEKNMKRREILQNFKEIWKIIWKNFGFHSALQWLIYQDDLHHLLGLTLRDIKKAFVGG